MNITAGQTTKKEHLRNGSKTACNRKSSGIGLHDFNDYKWHVTNYPEDCCKICLSRFNEKLERLNR